VPLTVKVTGDDSGLPAVGLNRRHRKLLMASVMNRGAQYFGFMNSTFPWISFRMGYVLDYGCEDGQSSSFKNYVTILNPGSSVQLSQ
jgi:hypothetical protein